MLLQEYAADIRDLSAFWFDNDDDEQGPDALMLEGYGPLADRLAEGVEVRCNSEVVRITRGAHRWMHIAAGGRGPTQCRELLLLRAAHSKAMHWYPRITPHITLSSHHSMFRAE